MVIRKYAPFPITAMRNMIDGTGKLNSQFSSHDESVSESKNTRQSLFSILRFDPKAPLVPYVESKEEIFLKTIIPSRKATQRFLGDKQ